MEKLEPPRPNELDSILLACPQDAAGMYEIGSDRLERLRSWMDGIGVLTEEPGAARIAAGVAHARELEASGVVADTLNDFDFISEYRAKAIIGDTSAVHMWLERPLYADPDRILGAVSFGSWLGRGYEGQGEVAIRESRGNRTSLAQITDYATRETQLPYLSADGGMNLVFSQDGPFLFSSNAHRAAAAKLRKEPLGFRRLSIYNADL